ncbi:alkaline phosphatase [Chloroflexota bacterium]|nr:alkaline phosphatase [Chloroflexota bacterium]
MKKTFYLLLLVLMLSGCVAPTPQINATATETSVVTEAPTLPVTPRERPRIMLFIGDGMGAEHRRAGQYYSLGEVRKLAMNSLDVSGWLSTESYGDTLPDSGASATAMATGVLTDIERIGVDPDGNTLTSILEIAQAQGMSVGLVSTKYITDATTAAFATHVYESSMRDEIAEQMLEHGVDVILGGGEDDFLPTKETGCYPELGNRTDGRNLVTEAQDAGYVTICDAAGLAQIDPATDTKVLGLFADENMERPYSPTLAEMTETAIAILDQNPNGYFLMVEGAMIDIASHFHESQNVMDDVIGFDEAVAVGVAAAEGDENTLVIVTADHETGGLVVNYDPTGTVDEGGPFQMPNGTEFWITWHSGDHTYAHVPVTALGDGAEAFIGLHENTFVFEVMLRFMGVE